MHVVTLFVAQLAVVLAATWVGRRVARLVGQPGVVGEMAAGLALGPSLLGALAPAASAALFAPTSLTPLARLAELVAVLFMFVVGLRLGVGAVRGQARVAAATSQASIAIPFALGLALATALYERFAGAGVSKVAFALYVGAAMSVTAFPVLARIIEERRLADTRIGAVAIASAAVDDVTAWGLLTLAVASSHAAGVAPALRTLGGVVLYVAVVIVVARPLLARAFAQRTSPNDAAALIAAGGVALASAFITDRIGVHALFGAVLAGAVMPRDGAFAARIAQRFDPFVTALLPVFFALTGVRTALGLVRGADAWTTGALIVGVAVAGKLGGAAIAARLSGLPWREAFALGALLNTRGMMELVILNVGLDAGVITPPLFALMVLMALVTTAMTAPLLAFAGAAVRRPVPS